MCFFSVFWIQKCVSNIYFLPVFLLGCLPNVNSSFVHDFVALRLHLWRGRQPSALAPSWSWKSKLKRMMKFQTQECSGKEHSLANPSNSRTSNLFHPDFYKKQQTQCHKFSFSGQFSLPWLPEISATRRGHGLAICGGTWIDCMSGESNLKIVKRI